MNYPFQFISTLMFGQEIVEVFQISLALVNYFLYTSTYWQKSIIITIFYYSNSNQNLVGSMRILFFSFLCGFVDIEPNRCLISM